MTFKKYQIKYTEDMDDEILNYRIEDLPEINVQDKGTWSPCVGNEFYKGHIFSNEFLKTFDFSGNTFILYSELYQNKEFPEADRFGMIIGKSKEIPKIKRKIENLLEIKLEEISK